MKNWRVAANAFYWLLMRDLASAKKDFLSNMFDSLMIPFGISFIAGYILPSSMGMPANYGMFIHVAMLAGMICNSTSTLAGDVVADLGGDKSIAYELTLPLPSWLIYLRMGLLYVILACVHNILVLPAGIVLFYSQFSFASFSLTKTVGMYVVVSFFFSFFALFTAFMSGSVVGYSRFWIRWGWLLMCIGGFQCNWQAMWKAFPLFALGNLLNPCVYVDEGLRAAIMGQKDFISFAICVAVLICVTIGFVFLGLRSFRRRLDCV